MTTENQITECRLCPGRVCVVQGDGRLINDSPPGTTDTSKIRMSQTPIENCDLREALATDDERSLVGS